MCHLVCLRQDEVIHKEDHGLSIYTCSAYNRCSLGQNPWCRQIGTCANSLTPSASRVSNIQCSLPSVGQCTASLSVSAMTDRRRFGTAPFTLPLVPDCTIYDAVFSVSSYGNPSSHFFFHFIFETINDPYMSRID